MDSHVQLAGFESALLSCGALYSNLLEMHHCCKMKVPRSMRGRCPTFAWGGALPLFKDRVNFWAFLTSSACLLILSSVQQGKRRAWCAGGPDICSICHLQASMLLVLPS
ncbi:hypothetical protein PVAP13_6NG123506 [Panicum virgatum]|uniref:Uncharacterized protein n=1 Tax=Panicum virgatum TaxID=38727 RepID=A0A8T0R073_PANVG|nr:hypothetical protein PVAP13_6NG123506 [Panicum virgatum]